MKYMGMRNALLYLIILVLQQTTIHSLSMPLHLLRIMCTYMFAVQLGSTTGPGPATLSPPSTNSPPPHWHKASIHPMYEKGRHPVL